VHWWLLVDFGSTLEVWNDILEARVNQQPPMH